MKHILSKLSYRKHSAYIMFFITATMMVVVSMIVSNFINRMEKSVEDSIHNHLLAAARAASTFLTVEELDLFHTIEDMEKSEWSNIRARLQQFAIDYNVKYVYYWRFLDDKIQYIIDNDEDEESMATPELYFSLDEDPETAEAVPHIINGGTWVTDLGTYTATWFGLISGLTPVFNDDGSVYCAVGVDVSDEILMEQRTIIRIMRIVLILSIIFSILTGYLGMRLYHKKAIQSDYANKAKSQFLSTVSHEIRSPMNAILGIAQIELYKGNLPKKNSEALEKIYNSGHNLLETINDILDFSKIESGKLELHTVEYNVPNLLYETAQLNLVRIGSKPIEFIFDIDETLPTKLIGDEIRLKQILNNLLSNAIKYTEKGSIKLSVDFQELVENEKQGQNNIFTTQNEKIGLRFIVEDTGQGMKPEDVPKLFSEYVRFNVETNRTTEGTGIGLNITKNLVSLMEGSIDVESEYQKGSKFTVIVLQNTVQCEPIGYDISQQFRSFTYSGLKHHVDMQFQRYEMPFGKVLVVDDMETNLYVAEGLMSPYGLQIEKAKSGYEAIEKVKNGKKYDVIFMDHLMPLIDGIETTLMLRAMGCKDIIIALTANVIQGSDVLFQQNGFDDIISKPIDVKVLNDMLNKYIRDKHQFITSQTISMDINIPKPILLQTFRKDAEKAVITLKNTSFTENLRLYTTTVHAMKSALANIGDHFGSDKASDLEKASQRGDFKFIVDNTENFIEYLESLIKEIKPIKKSQIDIKISQEDKRFMDEQISLINASSEKYDDIAIFQALDLLKEKTWNVETIDIIEKIHYMIYFHSDFEGVYELTKIL
ncbi:MAG: ATP-binding protein [Candidatus Cloacimonetes bacterium]|nr:ATP-binding protein [Candidatus Cloacimonadota bacterium]